jgi:hypothetical protein
VLLATTAIRADIVDVPVKPAATGAASAVITWAPLSVGFQEHVATLLLPDPAVGTEIHPAIRVFPAKNVINDGTSTVAEIVLAVLKIAVVGLPLIDKFENTGTVVL